MSVIRFERVGKTFVSRQGREAPRAVEALADVSFEVREREFLSILGPSGCGKTTCLRILAGLTDYDSGSVTVLGATGSIGESALSSCPMPAKRGSAASFA